MRFERLDLNLLVALNALLEEQNVSAAAARVCLSQSAMSGALNRLREYFNDELLIPVGRRMVLTPRALELVEPVRSALLLIKTTIAIRPEFDPATSTRRFAIACSDYIVDVLVARLLQEVQVLAPGLSFDLLLPDQEIAGRLERGEVDLFVCPEQYLAADQPKAFLFEDEHAVLAWRDNPALDAGVTEALYYQLPHVIARFGRERHPSFVEAYFQQQSDRRRVEVSASYFSMVPGLLVGTTRIATMLRRHAEHYAQLLPVKVHPLPVAIPNVREMVQWHAVRQSDPGLQWLVEQIRRVSEAQPSLHRAA